MSNAKSTLSRRAFVAALGLTSVAGMGLLAGCGKENAETDTTKPVLVTEGVLTVGSDCEYPPFTYLDGDQASGFEYELMSAICAEIGLECVYHNPLKFDTLCASVAAGESVEPDSTVE